MPQPPLGVAALPEILLPAADELFAARARRLRQLAEGHCLGDFLRFAAAICEAQQKALDSPVASRVLEGPDGRSLELARVHRMPPLSAQSVRRGAEWRSVLFELTESLRGAAPPQTMAVIDGLCRASVTELEGLAEAALASQWQHSDRASLTLVSAALQMAWTRGAARLAAASLERLDIPNLCPVCGSLPVGSVIRIGAEQAGLRYLHCSLCNTEWHMVRAQCSQCSSADGHAYMVIDGTAPAVVGETCDECHGYLKLFRMDRDPQVEPVADDLATLALDILLDERGYGRLGPNPYLVPGPN